MKKIISLVSDLVIISNSSVLSVLAAEYHEPIQNDDTSIVDTFFNSLSDDDKVLPMPDGGYLYGGIVETNLDDESEVYAVYDSELDPSAITVKEAKKLIEEDAKIPNKTPRQATPPNVGSLYFVKANGYYFSDYFTGKGWRFSNYMFKPQDGTGNYLRWTSQADSGRVGNYNNAVSTYNGTTQGTSVGANQTIWFNGNSAGQIYYTYNPAQGTRYLVENQV